ncbi:MAG: PDZ domain-containing protein [Phycisphaerae bacterium]
MRKAAVLVLVMLLATTTMTHADATSDALAKISKKTDGAVAMLAVTIKTQLDTRAAGGPAICIDAQRGIFLTTALSPGLRSEDVQKCELAVSGTGKRIKGKLLGIDPGTGLGFVEATEKHDWKEIQFSAKSGLEMGDKVVSAGLMLNVPSFPTFLGTGYVGAKLRLPDHLIYVTGGSLTSVCSPVFSMDGRAIGIVGRQLFMDYQTATRRGPVALPLKGTNATSFFVPVEEFVDVLTNIPTGGKTRRLSWLGVNTFKPVASEDAGGKVAVEIGQVIPDQPAAKAGLQEGDVIVGVDGKGLEELGTPKLTMQNFVRDLTRMSAGSTVKFTVLRGTETKEYPVKLAVMPKTRAEAKRYINKEIGLAIREKVMLDKYLDDSPTADVEGLVVINLGKGMAAQAAGVLPGDVITHVGEQKVSTVDAFTQLLEQDLAQTGVTQFTIRRGDGVVKPVIRPVKRGNNR